MACGTRNGRYCDTDSSNGLNLISGTRYTEFVKNNINSRTQKNGEVEVVDLSNS